MKPSKTINSRHLLVSSNHASTSLKSFLFHFPKFWKIGSFHLLRMFIIAASFVSCLPAWTQSPVDACRSGCTSKDVVVTFAYLSDVNGNPIQSFVCGVDKAYLSLNLSTKTPRVGVSIYTDINNYNPGTGQAGSKIDDVGQCFGNPLSTSTNVVTFSTAIEWDCSGPIALTNTYVAWGTGNTNFCTGAGFQCGGTPSKCNLLPAGQLIVIQVPQTGNASAEKCSSTAGSFSATFNLNDLKGSIITSQDNYNFSFYTDDDYEAADLISDPANFSCTAASTTVYAKVCDKSNANACSTAELKLTVYEKPSLPAFTITQPSLCGPSTGSISFCAVLNGYSYKVGTTEATNGVVSNLAAGSNPSITITNTNTGNITAGCANTFTCSQAVATCPPSSERISTNTSTSQQQQQFIQQQASVTAYPNPFSDKIKFVVTSSLAGKGSLEVYNMLGQKVKTVYQGQFVAGNQNFELNLPSTYRSNLIYVLRVGEKRITGKLLHLSR